MNPQSSVQALPVQDSRPLNDPTLTVVQTFLNAAIGCITHTRELIPWVSNCFQTRHVNQLRLDGNDACQMHDEFRSELPTQSDGSQEFRMLLRGKNEKADRLLDLIDLGILASLNQGLLDAFQILIIADPIDPATVLEAYTFSFTYDHGNISRISLVPQGNASFELKDVYNSFASSIRGLLRSLKDLPRLPRRRSLGISLLFNESCPQNYQPSGFIDVKLSYQIPLKGSWAELWRYPPEPLTDFMVGSRRVVIGAQNLCFASGLTRSRLEDIKMSRRLQNLQQTSSQGTRLDATAVPVLGSDAAATIKVHHDRTTPLASPFQNSRLGQQDTQYGLDTSDVTKNGLAQLSVIAKNRRRRNVVAGKLAELIVQARAMENTYRGFKSLFDKAQLCNGKIWRLDRTGAIHCECGSTHTTTSLLVCELCGTRQHRLCYGYESLRPGCLPEEHFCYDCLLLPRENTINHAMPGIVHMRLALLYLAGRPTCEVMINQSFLESVFFERKDAATPFANLIDRLINEGYIEKVTDQIAYIIDKNDTTPAQTAYLDPLAGIVHHYQIARDGDTLEKRRREVLEALESYIGDKSFSFVDATNSCYDRIHAKSNSGEEVIRWGFYASKKRKSIEVSEIDPLRRKMSVSCRFVSIDRSSPTETMSINQGMEESISEAQWDLKLGSRFRTVGAKDD